ncbi:MAG: hypothetical protein HY681_05535 [Chloroflexi bacterium]|nr:hypothetical protein [Chloroflexota bacterium]
MKKSAAVPYAFGIAGVILAAFALLAPASIVNAAREKLPVGRTAIVDEYSDRSASVDTRGNLQVKVSDPVTAQVLNFPGMQNVKVINPTLPIEGSVKVSNLPSVQQVTGVVIVGNLPAIQNVNVTNKALPVSGSVAVSNLPAVQDVKGTVQVGNLPAVQTVSGSISVSNLPGTQNVSGTVNVGNLPATQNVNVTNGILPIAGSVAVSNLPVVQPVSGTVNVGKLPGIDPSSVFNFFVFQVNQTKPLDACNAGQGFVVPTGKLLMVTDIVLNPYNSSPFPGIWSESRGLLLVVQGASTAPSFAFSTPLVLHSNEKVCTYTALGASTFDLFISGQLVDAP